MFSMLLRPDGAVEAVSTLLTGVAVATAVRRMTASAPEGERIFDDSPSDVEDVAVDAPASSGPTT